VTVTVKFLNEFKELFNEQWRNIVFYGGRGSGKSRHVAIALLLRGRTKKLRILCTREIQNTIKDSVHKLLSDLIDQYGFTDYEVTERAIRNTITGTEFIFAGLRHNVNEIKSMEGIDICWVEEAQSISEASLKVLVPTIRKPGSQLIYTFNRLTELDPVYVRYVMTKRKRTYAQMINFDVLDRAGLYPD
jgi:phage terminase large subunit